MLRPSTDDVDAMHSVAGVFGTASTVIGRVLELGRVRALVDTLVDADDYDMRACVISGEAGVGKTRLLGHALEAALGRGCITLFGQAHEYDDAVAYSMLSDVIASAPERVRDASGQHFDELAAVLETDLRTAPSASHPQRLVARLTELLRCLADASPVVIALDDAHLADDSSLIALALACRHLRRSRLLLVVATRSDQWTPGGTLAATVGRIAEQANGVVIRLEPLTRGELAGLVEEQLGADPDDRLLEQVFSASRGNPLFAREMLEATRTAGGIHVDGGRAYLRDETSTVRVSRRGALLHRLFQRDHESREVARVLSAFGRVALGQLPAVARVLDIDERSLFEAVDRLVGAAVLVSHGAGRFSFAHSLVREALYQDLGPVERRKLLTGMSDSLRASADTENGLYVWARTVVETADVGDSEAIGAALEAANAARRRAPASAAYWYQHALDLLPEGAPERGDVLAWQATCYWKGTQPRRAVAAAREAVTLLPVGPLRTSTLQSAVGAAYAMHDLDAALALLRLTTVDDTAGLHAQRALVLGQKSGVHASERHRRASEGAVRDAPPAERALACIYLGFLAHLGGDRALFDNAATELERLVLDRGDVLQPAARLSALEGAACFLLLDGQLGRARPLLDESARVAQCVGWNDLGGQAAYGRCKAMYWSGRWDEALDSVASESVRLEFAELEANRVELRIIEADIHLERGRTPDALSALDKLTGLSTDSTFRLAIDTRRARALVATGRFDEATSLLDELEERAEARSWADLQHLVLGARIDCYVAQGRTEDSFRCAQQLVALAEQTGMRAHQFAARIAQARFHGELDGARDVVETARAEGLPLIEARARLALAEAGAADVASLQRAHDLFLGLAVLGGANRVAALARATGVTLTRSPARPGAPAGVTESELHLARLVRDGLNNKQIAEQLHYSRKTIEVYLSRLYRKTGTNSRMSMVMALADQIGSAR